MSQVVDPAHVDGNEIDLDVVRDILSRFTYHDFQEAQEQLQFPLNEGAHCRRCPFFQGYCPAGNPAAAATSF